jgi:hypothetical protein
MDPVTQEKGRELQEVLQLFRQATTTHSPPPFYRPKTQKQEDCKPESSR